MHASCRDHGRPDNETPVHLAYRIRQEWVDLGHLADGAVAVGMMMMPSHRQTGFAWTFRLDGRLSM